MPTLVQSTVDAYAKSRGFVKRAGSWYLKREDIILVLNLQKSNYGRQYFLNIGLWLNVLGTEQAPQEQHCHIRSRLSRIAADAGRAGDLMDADKLEVQADGAKQLTSELASALDPLISLASSMRELAGQAGAEFLSRALVTGSAQRALADAGSPRPRPKQTSTELE
ncbi:MULTISPECIES: DUF4304 domain-containing protein [Aestuariimicrobium]|uniref:DUF4304 domain-containing protein n=1 Tax=Aestuariimicrobium TaxID=396388 RepID=UPI0003B33AF7|nr:MULTISPECIES: DUF4304 domain-containing protein [Aestuariimicrobium]CAI9404243.1 hypothetical protein AESSP_01168 [Aestuariimicrobium sp. T2.26MG-19.2B]